jgi:hypothetical protein
MSEFCRVYAERGLRDIDKDLVLYYLNYIMSSELTKAEYGNLIDWYDKKKKFWL